MSLEPQLDHDLNNHFKSLESDSREEKKQEILNYLSNLFPALEEMENEIGEFFDDEIADQVQKAYNLLDQVNTKLKTL